MLIFWDAGLVLLAVPKTGTQALEAALAPHADLVFRNPPRFKHMRLTWAQKALPRFLGREDFKRFRTVAVVREPIDWLGSWYRYRRRDALAGREVSTRDIDFATFLEAHIADPVPAFADVGSQARFVQGADGVPEVDFLFAYEQMDRLIDFFEEMLSEKIELERRNVSPPAALDAPEEVVERVRMELIADCALHAAVLDEGPVPVGDL